MGMIVPISFTMLCLLLGLFVAGFAFNIQEVRAMGGTIYIMADGSISPSTAPIHLEGALYTLLGNISDTIVVERSNIVIDGNGYTLEGNGAEDGFLLEGVRNVTLQKTDIRALLRGVVIRSLV